MTRPFIATFNSILHLINLNFCLLVVVYNMVITSKLVCPLTTLEVSKLTYEMNFITVLTCISVSWLCSSLVYVFQCPGYAAALSMYFSVLVMQQPCLCISVSWLCSSLVYGKKHAMFLLQQLEVAIEGTLSKDKIKRYVISFKNGVISYNGSRLQRMYNLCLKISYYMYSIYKF